MEDLEAAINKGDQDLVNEANGNNIQNPEIDAKVHDTVVREDTVGVDAETLFKEEDFIIGLFVDGPYPGKIVKVNPETIVGNFMHPATINGVENFEFWKWPSNTDEQTISKLSVLPIHPTLDIAYKYSSNRCVTFHLSNYELVAKFK